MWIGAVILTMLILFLVGFVLPTLWRAMRILAAPADRGQKRPEENKDVPTAGRRARSRTVSPTAEGSRLTIQFRDCGRTRVMELAGDLDLYTSEAFKNSIQTEIDRRTPLPLVVDMTLVPYTDSSGWSALVTAHKALGAGGRALSVMLAPETQPEQTYEVMGMAALLTRTALLTEAA